MKFDNMKITKIIIRNFKAFHGKVEIKVDGKNFLVYGENGAGKSSFAESLRAIFVSDELLWKIVDASPVNIFLPEGSSAEVEIVIDNPLANRNFLEFDGSMRSYNANLSSFVLRASTVNGFLTYKQLLEIYFIPLSKSQVNIYELLAKNLLSYTINPVTAQPFKRDFDELNGTIPKRNTESTVAAVNELLTNINAGFKKVLDELISETNRLLNYFNYGFTVEKFVFHGLWYNSREHCVDKNSERVQLKVNFFGESLDNYSDILNEARLTALAICIYLASIKIVPEPELKVLILDDIMIGLDMGNRQPIVDILQNEFADWQIFFMTYDRFWFEKLKKHSFIDGWTTAEMYVNNSGRFPKPVIIQPSLSNIDKCRNYFASHDYPASANYLRKAFEEFLYGFLPKNLQFVLHNNGTITKDTTLDSLWTKFSQLIKEWSLEVDCSKKLQEFTQIKAYILNPLSHHDLESPLYADEVNNAIKFYEWLIKYECVKKLGTGEEITFELDNGCKYNFLVQDDFYLLKYNHQVCGISKQVVKPLNYVDADGNEHNLEKEKEGNFKQHFNKIAHCLEISVQPSWYMALKSEDENLLENFELTFFGWLKNESITNLQYKDLYDDMLFFTRGYPEQPIAPTHSNNYFVWRKHLEEERAVTEAKEVLKDAFHNYYSFVRTLVKRK